MIRIIFKYALFAGLGAGLVAQAQDLQHETAPSSLSDIVDLIQADSRQLSLENSRRLEGFKQKRERQKKLLADIKAEIIALDKKGKELAAKFDKNENILAELQEKITIEAGDIAEFLGQFRTTAGAVDPVLRRSIISQQYTGRSERMNEVSQTRSLPSREQLDFLWKALLQEAVGQSEITSFEARVANLNDGNPVGLTRIGPFSIFTNTSPPEFVEVVQGKLFRLGKQPNNRIVSAANDLLDAKPGEIVRAPIDPSRGDLLALLANIPSLTDRIQQGGLPGYVVLVLLCIGLAVGTGKLITLSITSRAIRETANTRQSGTSNALERIFLTYQNSSSEDVEALELRLDETILKEIPTLERGIDIIKVLAAVAPMLGLLGTVVGMIRTFTQITLVGTGDPKTMADGISQALVTTVEGLIAAIPLILLHTIVSGRAQSIRQLLEEQAAGMIAEQAEKKQAHT